MTTASKPAVEAGDVEGAMKWAIRLLGVRARSCHEIRERLLRAGFDEATAAAVESRLLDVGLLDDAAFAAQVVRRGAESGKSSWLTRRELQRFGIGGEAAGRSLDESDGEAADEERALALAQRKAVSCRGLPPEKAMARVVRHLGSKGYGPHLAWEVTRKVFRALDVTDD